MKYYLCQKIDQKHIKVSEHSSKRALDLAFKKSKKENLYTVLIPDNVSIGYKFYNSLHKFIGEITQETNNLWVVKRPKDKTIQDCMIILKESFEQKFIDQHYVII